MACSNPITVTISVPAPTLSAPIGVQITGIPSVVTSNTPITATLVFNLVSGANKYGIYSNGNLTSYTTTNSVSLQLSPGQSGSVQIRAFLVASDGSIIAQSPLSAAYAFSVPAFIPGQVDPSTINVSWQTPTNAQTVIGTLSWGAVNGASGYQVSLNGGSPTTVNGTSTQISATPGSTLQISIAACS